MDIPSLVWVETLNIICYYIRTRCNKKKRHAYTYTHLLHFLVTTRKRTSTKKKKREEKILNKCGPYYGNIMSIKIPYMRKDRSSTLLVLSAAILMVLSTTPLLLFNVQPAQASSNTNSMIFRTRQPANGTLCTGEPAALTLYAHGPISGQTNNVTVQIDDGQFQITNSSSGDSNSGTILYSTSLLSGQYIEYNNSQSGTVDVTGQVTGQVDLAPNSNSTCATDGQTLEMSGTWVCFSEKQQNFSIYNEDTKRDFGKFQGQMDCITVINNDARSSSSLTGSSQDRDGDGDGIPDSTDKCTHNSNPRCFKEGDTRTITTQQ